MDILVQSPGDFFYHVVVALTLSAGLAVALGQLNRRPQSRTASRYSLAVGGALLGWFVLIAGALFAVFTGQDARAILPPLERAVTVSAMALLGWAFLTADTEQGTRLISIGLFVVLLTTVAGYVLTGLQWARLVTITDFNASQVGSLWAGMQVFVALVGVLLLIAYSREVIDAPLKLIFYSLLLLGTGATLWRMVTGAAIGDYSGLTRLAFFVAVPIVPLVIYRKVVYGYELALDMTTTQSRPVVPVVTSKPPSPPASADDESTQSMAAQPFSQAEVAPQSSPVERESVQLLRVLGLVLEQAEPSDIPQRIVKAALEVLKADVGALLDAKNAHYADILVAYDAMLDRPIPAMISLNLEQQVTLQNAIERQHQRPLFVDRNPDELADLYNRLDISETGAAYFQPLMRDNKLMGVLVVALPYTKRELRETERELLKGIGIISGSLLALSYAADEATIRAEERAIQAIVAGVPLDDIEDADVLNAHQEMQDALDAAKSQNQALQKQVAELKQTLDSERDRLTTLLGGTEQGLSISQRIVALNEEQEDLREERDTLAQQLEEAETALASATGTDKAALFQSAIEMLNREKQDLEAELESLRKQLEGVRGHQEDALPQAAQDVVQTMAIERERLADERDKLEGRLDNIESQLKSMGLEVGPAGLAQMVRQLYDQRSALQARTDALQVERDALLNERRRFEQRMKREEEREKQLEALEAEVRHLAADREAITRQRDEIRSERDQLTEKVDKMKQQRARLLADLSAYESNLQDVQDELTAVKKRLEKATDERGKLAAERDRLQGERWALESERDTLLAQLEGNQFQLQQLSADVQREMKDMIADITGQRDALEQELGEALEQLSLTKQQRNELQRRLAQVNGNSSERSAEPELLMSMVQELRTPMTSIVGYVDLLVSESAGILSEMQRKFIQRISANIVRLETMLNDLVHLAALDTGQYQLKLSPADVVEMLEDAITSAAYQFREKDLSVHLQLDDTIPDVYVDKRGLAQVIGQLLTNAYLVSPAEGHVSITAEQRQMTLDDQETDVIFVSIADSGDGIAADDLDDVFARRYRSDHNLVVGLGDTGVGLPIAKAIVEVHGGKMWVESESDTGTVFQFALPMDLTPQAEPSYAT